MILNTQLNRQTLPINSGMSKTNKNTGGSHRDGSQVNAIDSKRRHALVTTARRNYQEFYTRALPVDDPHIYMNPPHGMILTAEERVGGGNEPVLKLMKHIYGLKQAGRLRHQMLSEKSRKLNYKQSSVDMCLYYKIMKATLFLVGVYVDELLLTSNEV
jgi:hypothetical protein